MSDVIAVQYYLEPAAIAAGCVFDAPRSGDAGYDLYSAESLVIAAGEQVLVSTGLFVAIPQGWVGIIKDRSSIALKKLRTHAGVIDASYRGEVKVCISNASQKESFHLEAGAKFAQLVVVPHASQVVAVLDRSELGQTNRADAGFGSTGSQSGVSLATRS